MAKMLLKVGSKVLTTNGKALCGSGFPITWNLSRASVYSPNPRPKKFQKMKLSQLKFQ